MFLINKSLLLVILCTMFIPFVAFQDSKMQSEIIHCFETGNSKILSTHFNQNVEIAVSGNKNAYSKAQAQQILGKFFSGNIPESFKLLSNTRENDAQNMIGTLQTKNATFRVYILLKKTGRKDYIHLLKIEKRKN